MNAPNCPKCGANVSVAYPGTYECGTGVNMPWSTGKLCEVLQRAQRAEATLNRVREFCIKHAGHKLMQVAQPFRELVNILKQ